MFFQTETSWDEPGEPLVLTFIRKWGQLNSFLTGKGQYIAGDHSADSRNNFDDPTQCSVIANPLLFDGSYSLWVEERIARDGPGDYCDEVSFRSLGIVSSTEMHEIVARFKERERS
jgi:hypothetical protein